MSTPAPSTPDPPAQQLRARAEGGIGRARASGLAPLERTWLDRKDALEVKLQLPDVGVAWHRNVEHNVAVPERVARETILAPDDLEAAGPVGEGQGRVRMNP